VGSPFDTEAVMSTVAGRLQRSVASGPGPEHRERPGLRRVGRIIWLLIVGNLSTLGLWLLFVQFVHMDQLVKKSPADVWRYLFDSAKAEANRHALFGALRTTMGDFAVGYVLGIAAGVFVSSVFLLSPTLRRTFLPFALLLRSVPLIVTTPIIGLVFGYTFTSVRVVTAIVTFFPSLVNITLGLESVPQQAADLISAYGGNERTTLLKVRLPYAVPSLFAAMRIAVPGAMVGALLGEWLLTTKGIGHYLVERPARFDYAGVWSAVAVVTMTTLVLYAIVGILETPVLAVFDPERLKEE
jgi:ABC-type nitrate/sulfonate/bicarbonate transport system permease component